MDAKPNLIKILIADDHAKYRQGLRLTLDIEEDMQVIGDVDNWPMLVRALHGSRPNIILMDLRVALARDMGIMDGIDATKRILRDYPSCAIIILTMMADELYSTRAAQAGARGYVLKDAGSHQLLQTIREVAQGDLDVRERRPPAIRTNEHYTNL